MNYYPNNFYGNTYPQMSSLITNNFNQNLFGKVVDGEEVVKATEVLFGGYGVFPKADLNEIYVKTWTPEGKTKIIKFQPVIEQSETMIDTNSLLLQKVTAIEDKINSLFKTTNDDKIISSSADKRKELDVSAY